ncbi:hypothetical protein B0H12DRAFT_1121689 [Mycena haematopus]|nr:hypothetical protein B0H12DRAFT_1121689 [Mycena haematopus]
MGKTAAGTRGQCRQFSAVSGLLWWRRHVRLPAHVATIGVVGASRREAHCARDQLSSSRRNRTKSPRSLGVYFHFGEIRIES